MLSQVCFWEDVHLQGPCLLDRLLKSNWSSKQWQSLDLVYATSHNNQMTIRCWAVTAKKKSCSEQGLKDAVWSSERVLCRLH